MKNWPLPISLIAGLAVSAAPMVFCFEIILRGAGAGLRLGWR
jgi:hypothetical protein